ncbi:MAG: hypothetical protein ACKV22_40050 [Bryobacteraceae bacterium]
MAYLRNPSHRAWLGAAGLAAFGESAPWLPFGEFSKPEPPRCAAAELDVFLLDTILRRLKSQPGNTRLLRMLKEAVDSTLKALPTFVSQGCCEPHLKTLETEVSNMPWPVSQSTLRKQLLDAIRAGQQAAKKDFEHC